MFLDRILSVLTSLRLTVFCLACALVLVFAGTLAQVHLGLYVTQERYFHSLFVFWTPSGTRLKIPVWPGGYLIGGVLLVNLVAAHIKRFSLQPRKIGLFLIHAGLILLFVGQFLTETFQVESFMQLEEGETKNYTESARYNELAVIDVTDPAKDQITAIPEERLAKKGDIQVGSLPFTLRVKEYYPNSAPAPAMQSVAGDMQRIEATQGVGQRIRFRPDEVTVKSDDENKPLALLEVVTPEGSLGTWTVSTWLSKFPYPAGELRRMLGNQGAFLDTPQQIQYKGRTYQLAMRPIRYYLPYNLTLLDFTHKRYKGTDIPKDFSSRVRVRNPENGEDREVLIYMNNPLRYSGETYYQGGFLPGDTVSILQVVSNPAWLTPYFSCTLVGVGLTVHFLMHLVGFAKKRKQTPAAANSARPAASRPRRSNGPGEPELAEASAPAFNKSVSAGQAKRRNA